VCDWDCIPADYRWTQDDFDYHYYNDKLYKHCKYYDQHNVDDYCDHCMVNCDKIYQIRTQYCDSWYDTTKRNDLCYDLKFPNGNRFRLERIYKCDIGDFKFMHKCINCNCNVAYTTYFDDYFDVMEKIEYLKLNKRYMFCYDCYIQKQIDFTSNDVSHTYETEYFDRVQREYFSTNTFKCDCIYQNRKDSVPSHWDSCYSRSDNFDINDFLSGNIFIKK
jgi:hypothetical protein